MKLQHLFSLLLLAGVTGLRAVTIYSTDFTGTDGATPSGWNTIAGLAISGNNYAANGVSNGGSVYNDGLGASGITGLDAYTVSADFSTSAVSSGVNIGLVAFSNATVANFYVGRIRSTAVNVWALEIYKFNTAATLISSTSVNINLASNTTFHMTFAVDAAADTQTFSVLTSAGGTLLGSVSATDASLSSGLAGVRMTDGSAVLTYENFAVNTAAIPEPASAALLGGLGFLGLALVRRRGVRAGR